MGLQILLRIGQVFSVEDFSVLPLLTGGELK